MNEITWIFIYIDHWSTADLPLPPMEHVNIKYSRIPYAYSCKRCSCARCMCVIRYVHDKKITSCVYMCTLSEHFQ